MDWTVNIHKWSWRDFYVKLYDLSTWYCHYKIKPRGTPHYSQKIPSHTFPKNQFKHFADLQILTSIILFVCMNSPIWYEAFIQIFEHLLLKHRCALPNLYKFQISNLKTKNHCAKLNKKSKFICICTAELSGLPLEKKNGLCNCGQSQCR